LRVGGINCYSVKIKFPLDNFDVLGQGLFFFGIQQVFGFYLVGNSFQEELIIFLNPLIDPAADPQGVFQGLLDGNVKPEFNAGCNKVDRKEK